MGENFRRNQAKAFKHRECEAYTTRLASANLLSGVKGVAETVDAMCDLMDRAAAPPLGAEVLIQARSLNSADVILCNRRVATVDLAHAGLEHVFGLDRMAVGVVTMLGEITPTITVSIPRPPEAP